MNFNMNYNILIYIYITLGITFLDEFYGEFLVSASLFFRVSGNDWKLDELALYKVGFSQDFCVWRRFIPYNCIKNCENIEVIFHESHKV